ncbi:ankyrin repeat-containing domain protein [Aspergillus karnatakaensis]|uniref:ankyrin repeat-containing domain protein n=1 Tax=Aspergillus karnatakaensis TaxID=1810916 RepID=UPI003CCE01BA
MVNGSSTALLDLPTEIIQQILLYLPVRDLDQNVDKTCKALRHATNPVFRLKYGRDPAPIPEVGDRWKLIAKRNEILLGHSDGAKKEVINGFLRCYFNEAEDQRVESAEEMIYYLDESPHYHDRGVEALIAALNIQHRPEESQQILDKYNESLAPDSKALLQARFGLDLEVSWNDCTVKLLNDCLLSAVVTENTSLFVTLKNHIQAQNGDVKYYSPLLVACSSGVARMLEYLLATCNVDIHATELAGLLKMAIWRNRPTIVKVLLHTGHFPNLETYYRVALKYGYLGVLEVFLEYSPDIPGTYFDNGDLQVVSVLKDHDNVEEIIEFLVKNASVDLNAIGKDGLAAVHVAAEEGVLEKLNILRRLGADMNVTGDIQQTAAEIAYCKGQALPFASTLPIDVKVKAAFSRSILERLRAETIRHLAIEYNKTTSEIGSLYDSVEDELLALWVREIGQQTLQELHRRLETSSSRFVQIYELLKCFHEPRGHEWLRDDHISCCSPSFVTEEDITNSRAYAATDTGRAFALRLHSFRNYEHEIWRRFGSRVLGYGAPFVLLSIC